MCEEKQGNVTDLDNVHFERSARLYVSFQVDVQKFKYEIQLLVGVNDIKESAL